MKLNVHRTWLDHEEDSSFSGSDCTCRCPYRRELDVYHSSTQDYSMGIIFHSKVDIKEGERIAILSPNHPELFAILFACEMKGLIYVPLNWRLSCVELVALLKDCTPAILLFHDQFRSLIDEMEFPHAVPLLSIRCRSKTGSSKSTRR